MKIIPTQKYIIKEATEKIQLKEIDSNIMKHLMEGNTHQQIADIIYRSKRTVDGRLGSLKKRFEAKTEVELIVKCIHLKLFTIK